MLKSSMVDLFCYLLKLKRWEKNCDTCTCAHDCWEACSWAHTVQKFICYTLSFLLLLLVKNKKSMILLYCYTSLQAQWTQNISIFFPHRLLFICCNATNLCDSGWDCRAKFFFHSFVMLTFLFTQYQVVKCSSCCFTGTRQDPHPLFPRPCFVVGAEHWLKHWIN